MIEERSMQIISCTEQDIPKLAVMNKQLIEDEKSSDLMSISELETRMREFLAGEYEAYFFQNEDDTVGYSLVRRKGFPPKIRQFFICRELRRMHLGTEAFELLLEELGAGMVDLEILPRNEEGIKFLEKLGFKETYGHMRFVEEPYELSDSQYEELISMIKELSDSMDSDDINDEQHNELIDILNELIETMQSMNSNYLLSQNLREAEDWRNFLKAHTDKEELRSLQKEIAERFVCKYDVQIDGSDLDYKRVDLMKEYLGKAGKYL